MPQSPSWASLLRSHRCRLLRLAQAAHAVREDGIILPKFAAGLVARVEDCWFSFRPLLPSALAVIAAAVVFYVRAQKGKNTPKRPQSDTQWLTERLADARWCVATAGHKLY